MLVQIVVLEVCFDFLDCFKVLNFFCFMIVLQVASAKVYLIFMPRPSAKGKVCEL